RWPYVRCPVYHIVALADGSDVNFDNLAPAYIHCLSLHDALPISSVLVLLVASVLRRQLCSYWRAHPVGLRLRCRRSVPVSGRGRSEEHTSELQSQSNLVCRLLPEKKKK